MSDNVSGAVAAAIVLVTVLRFVLLGRISVRYATFWLLVGVGVAVLGFVPGFLAWSAELLGFEVPANLLFTLGLVLLLLVGVHLSIAVTSLEQRTQRLAEELALAQARGREAGSSQGHAQ